MDPHHQEAIRSSVADALKNASRLLTRNDFNSTTDAVMLVVREEIAKAAAVWNFRFSRTQRMLPDEVLTACFAELEPRSRIRVACVSRVWRAVAFATPALWTELDVLIRTDSDVEIFTAFAARSSSMPLNLKIDFADVCKGQTSRLLQAHIHHIRSIDVSNSAYRALNLRGLHAPILETVAGQTVVLGSAPLLRSLRASCFRLQNIKNRYPSLVEFRGCIAGKRMSDFFKICPNLEHLELALSEDGEEDFLEWPHGHPVTTLKYLELIPMDGEDGADEPFVQSLRGCRQLRNVKLHDFSFSNALELFETIGHTMHSLSVDLHKTVLTDDVSRAEAIITNYDPIHVNRVQALPTLRKLIVTDLRNQIPANLALPSLTELTVEGPGHRLRRLVGQAGTVPGLINAPALYTLVLCYNPHSEAVDGDEDEDDYSDSSSYDWHYEPRTPVNYLTEVVAALPRILARFNLTRINTVIVTGEDLSARHLRQVDMRSIAPYVENLYHDNVKHDVLTVPTPNSNAKSHGRVRRH